MTRTLADDYRPEANSLNLIRLVLAVAVIASHSYPIAWGLAEGGRLEPLGRLTRRRLEIGSLAVDAFFAVSGFLLAASWGRGRGVGNFVTRRFLRIYPGFAVCLLVCVGLFGPLGGASPRAYFGSAGSYRLLRYLYLGDFFNGLPGAFVTNPMPTIADSSVWTIKYEVFCYVLLIGLGAARLLRPWPTLAAAAAFTAGYTAIDWLGLHPRLALAPDYMPRLGTCFLAGAALYLWRDWVPTGPGWFAAAAAVLVGTVRLWAWPDLVVPTAGTYCLFWLGTRPVPTLNRVGRRHDLSYGVYLYAWPVQQTLVHDGLGRGRPWVLTAATLPVVFAMAAVSWFAVERPALALEPTAFWRRRPAAVAA